MLPDFSKTTIDTLAKRAASLCSNPDCRVSTVGPNSESAAATVIGEAAHIHAARVGQARYNARMTDQARSEISNAIWLCRNCHKRVDRDATQFPADLLFLWRERHDEYVASNLGTQSDKARFDIARHALARFDGYPPVVRRIAFDKPPGWEWSLTAALMRHLNAALFRRLEDLRDGVCALQIRTLDDDQVMDWVSERMDEMTEMVEPLTKIIARINKAWGAPGQPGNVDEIHHATLLLRDALAKIIGHEERLRSVRVDPKYDEIVGLLQNALGSQAEKLKHIPDWLDGMVEMALRMEANGSTEPTVVHEVIEFTLPDGWSEQFNRALRKINRRAAVQQFHSGISDASGTTIGCIAWLFIGLLMIVFAQLF